MHIPDGFISPKVYLPAYVAVAGVWIYSIRKLRNDLDQNTLPFLGVMTAFAFIVSLIMVPLPGGSSAHVTGIGLLSIAFGPWTAFVSISVVLILQATLLGDGGITSFPVNAIGMGLIGGLTASTVFKLLKKFNLNFALFISGWLAVVISSIFIAFVLGVQPIIAHDPSGRPLFFPFDISITLPAVVIPHVFIGVLEGFLTVVGVRIYMRLKDER